MQMEETRLVLEQSQIAEPRRYLVVHHLPKCEPLQVYLEQHKIAVHPGLERHKIGHPGLEIAVHLVREITIHPVFHIAVHLVFQIAEPQIPVQRGRPDTIAIHSEVVKTSEKQGAMAAQRNVENDLIRAAKGASRKSLKIIF